jgi:hypothetical protein
VGRPCKIFKARLDELLGEQSGRAQDAVDILRYVVALRTGQQHSGTHPQKGARTARSELALSQFDGDWEGAWDHVRTVTVQALTTIREEVSNLIE